MSNQTRTYTKKERNMYLTGMLGQNLIYNIVATGLYFYFQNVICLPAMALGWIFALARVWDAINDPMIGSLADRTNTKMGRYRPWMLGGALGLIPLVVLLFWAHPGWSVGARTAAFSTSSRLLLPLRGTFRSPR